ncbi:MAG: type II toxin-antitoxin system VapC family toxin [Desulfobacterales bacterium]
MKFLLDTHIFLWWITASQLLSQTARDIISDGNSELFWSTASSWEVAIKYKIGRLPLPEVPESFIPTELAKNRIDSLPIVNDHSFRAGQLPTHHRDPFDRMLIAQAQIENMEIISSDHQISLYDVKIAW